MPDKVENPKEIPDELAWIKKKHAKHRQDKLEFHREFIKEELYEKRKGIAEIIEELGKRGLVVSQNTVRNYVRVEFAELGPLSSKRRRGRAQMKLDEHRGKIEMALYETDLSYRDMQRNLEREGAKVSMTSLIHYIENEIYPLRGRPERF